MQANYCKDPPVIKRVLGKPNGKVLDELVVKYWVAAWRSCYMGFWISWKNFGKVEMTYNGWEVFWVSTIEVALLKGAEAFIPLVAVPVLW